MPDLPTITVTSAQAQRLMAVFGTNEAYRAWLRDSLRSYVKIVERQHILERFESEVQASDQAVDGDLGSI